jgi:hypothetical protein
VTAWDDTLAAALLGTARRPPPVPSAEGRLGGVLATVGDRAPESALLATAGALAVYLRAGERPRRRPTTSLGRARRTRGRRPRRSRRTTCASCLAGDYAQLLEEWVREAAVRGWRGPAERLAAAARRSRRVAGDPGRGR